jgi:hypothetical protein
LQLAIQRRGNNPARRISESNGLGEFFLFHKTGTSTVAKEITQVPVAAADCSTAGA